MPHSKPRHDIDPPYLALRQRDVLVYRRATPQALQWRGTLSAWPASTRLDLESDLLVRAYDWQSMVSPNALAEARRTPGVLTGEDRRDLRRGD